MSGGLYPSFGSVGNQSKSTEKPSGDKVSRGELILSALLLKHQLIPSANTCAPKVWGMHTAVTAIRKPKDIPKWQTLLWPWVSTCIWPNTIYSSSLSTLALQYPYVLPYLVMAHFTELLLKVKLQPKQSYIVPSTPTTVLLRAHKMNR